MSVPLVHYDLWDVRPAARHLAGVPDQKSHAHGSSHGGDRGPATGQAGRHRPPVGVHPRRHSAVTAMLEAGINLKAVSDLLGHTDIRMTFNTYGHVSDATARAAMDALGRAMGYS